MKRLIPKQTKVKNTVWKCYSMPDIIVALILFAIIFICMTCSAYVWAVIFALITVGLLMPTQDGIMYTILLDNVRFLASKKKYVRGALYKESVESLTALKDIRADGCVEYTGGWYGRAIRIGQKNFGIEEDYRQNMDIDCFARALKMLDLTQCCELVKTERPANLDRFSKKLFAELNAPDLPEVRAKILSGRIDRLDSINNVRRQYLSSFTLVVYGRNEQDLDSTANSMAEEIRKAGLQAEIMFAQDTAVFLKYATGTRAGMLEREVAEIRQDKLALWTQPKEVSFTGSSFSQDGLEGVCLSVADYPLRVNNAWGSSLFHIPGTKVVMHFKPVDRSKAIKRIDKCISDMEAKRMTSYKASEATSAETHRETMMALLDSLQKYNETLMDVSVTITAYNYGRQPDFKKNMKKELSRRDFRPAMLYGCQTEGYRSTCPSPLSSITRYERGLDSQTAAAVFPFTRTSVTDEGGVMLGRTRSGAPFILDIWKRGSLYQNSNAMIIGKSGSGKSYFMKTLIANEWSDGVRIIVLDPENEYTTLAHNLGGSVIDVGNATEGRINPFHIYSILSEDGSPAGPEITFNTHLKTLEGFFRIVLEGAHSDVIELINSLVIDAYALRGITRETDCEDLAPEDFPTFADLLDALEARRKDTADEITLKELRTASLYLEKFVSGRYSDIWNGPSTMASGTDMSVFNFQSLFANKNNVVANAQMLLVFRYVEQQIINAREAGRRGESVRTMIIVDEAHLFIDPKYPIALDFFYSMCKRIRKYNGSFIPATQNIADWNASEALRTKTTAIIKNSQYMFIFKLSAPDMKDLTELFGAGESFNTEEQRRITAAATGNAFFIGSTELRESLKVEADRFVSDLFTKDTPADTSANTQNSKEGN
ncbi:MAG: DUF87 domain-containing protein [Clostridia bacterium]|nr:DUF87 domain-containing protein [Clostridia bacterium]